jgi:uncharacterized protein
MKYIVDTSVLVAYLNKRDNLHHWSSEVLDKISPPIYTCEAVIAEACFLLKGTGADEVILKMIADKYILLPFRAEVFALEISDFLKKYKKQKVSFADACLVKMLEINKNSIILTADSDFHHYRINRNKKINGIFPN